MDRNEGSRVGVEKEKGGEAVLQAKCKHIIFPEHLPGLVSWTWSNGVYSFSFRNSGGLVQLELVWLPKSDFGRLWAI